MLTWEFLKNVVVTGGSANVNVYGSSGKRGWHDMSDKSGMTPAGLQKQIYKVQ